ncbi:TPA: Dot/Icm T4SS effector Lem22 [Legionella pneumophila subsp. pneumophila]|uniref:Dot/Icm T4SS effector Lem22 n=1 Tax=Legionella pneumophila TaxID=446 RepID=UPI0001E3C241|nr:Dot/Icm T4SS effector Lem22 [Legionella pneumophila]MDC8029404.1 Dot/Icm T4SS effector Lem22 [Legionella pneumophila subsp. pneumophila]MDW8868473.1 Dot/Icm T4SS effector Lem22 [Legionella pneumophila]MDW8900730.1 Dot/Icm T4SS effector Lem22 [Legionella pneumophila]MDW8905827.1 Dot/Icm T4SS effector Lem22 [Legionella pneumophila]MDW8914483.1 Dot/Icm T4SS effector Lem22 [Legionella pneumophila]
MSAFKKGQNPVTELTRLKEYMEDQIAKAKESSSLTAQLKFLENAHTEHFVKMGSLTTIYKGGNEVVDRLKIEIRSLYEEMLALKDKCRDQIQQHETSIKNSPTFFTTKNNKTKDEEFDLDFDKAFGL